MAVTPGVGSIQDETARDYLKQKRAGVLTVIDGDRPYAVPMEHYYDGESLYMITSARLGGRKLAALRQSPRACYVVYDSRGDDPGLVAKEIRCRSVMLEGQIELSIKEMDTKRMGKVPVQMLKLNVETVSSWQCPRAEGCDWNQPWHQTYPDLLK